MNSVPTLLCLDPGESTGFCYFNTAGEPEHWGTIRHYEIKRLATDDIPTRFIRDAIRSLMVSFTPEIVLVERLPQNLSPLLREVVVICNEVGSESVSPGEWKPVTNRYPMEFKAATQHEKDAFRMGIWYQIKQGWRHL